MGLFNLFKPARTVLVVDAVSLNESIGMKGKVPPRNQLQTLRRLSRFAMREKMEVVAVLCGTPLNKAPSGEKFEGVTVLYSNSPDDHAKFLAKTASSKGGRCVMVSSSVAAEKILGSSARKMRVSTFRKAFDTGGEGDGPDGDRQERGGNQNGNRGNRPPRRKQPKSSNNKANNEPKKERPPKQMTEADAINELIDLVD
ncbi:hypothetical protein [Pontiella sp.]|uniref:hypothetical protein n=1 Tax=Pontiella sp. TaxID=2837462 RepID=UPI0035647E31